MTDRRVVRSITWPSNLTFWITLGWRLRRISKSTDLNRITIRDTLIPPPVLPAQAPMSIKVTRIVRGTAGHRLKSTVAKPVVVMMVPTWKAAWWKARARFSKESRIKKVMINVEAAMMARYHLASSQRKASLGFRI